MAWLHTWAGLLLGWVLFAIFATGTLTVFDSEIDYWMQPELHGAEAPPTAETLELAQRALRRTAGNAREWSIQLPGARRPVARIAWRTPDDAYHVRYLDPATGTLLTARATDGGGHFEDFHAQLHAGDPGMWLVSAVAVALLAILVSGVIIHRRIFKDFFTFQPGNRLQRAWLDGHAVTAVLALPFYLMIVYTGLVAEQDELMPLTALYAGGPSESREDEPRALGTSAPLAPLPALVAKAEREWGAGMVRFLRVTHPGDAAATITLYRANDDRLVDDSDSVTFDGVTGETLHAVTIDRPARRVQSSMEGLHYAEFGGAALRWLYFVCGLAGAVMIAAGLVLFTVKRQKPNTREAPQARRFYALAEKINVVAIAGVLLACIAYFWANRLLPAAMADRAWWEITAFFLVWFAALPHALLRPARRAWIEQLGIAAALCLLLPALNAATTDTHLLHTLPRGDWRIAGVDLTAIGIGLVLAWTARKVAGRPQTRSTALEHPA